jgi:hypothetical protein
VLPLPTVDSTQILPRWRSTIFLQIARPMPVPGYSLRPLQALEDLEDALDVGQLDADAVVAHGEHPVRALAHGLDVDLRRHAIAPELDGVADQVLEHLDHLHLVAAHHGQVALRHRGAALADRQAQVVQRAADGEARVHRREGRARRVDARVGQQVVDQVVHAARAVHREADEVLAVLVELCS